MVVVVVVVGARPKTPSKAPCPHEPPPTPTATTFKGRNKSNGDVLCGLCLAAQKKKEIKRTLMSSIDIPGASGDLTMTTKIPQHKHCILCGRAVQVDEDYCGDECKNLYDQRTAKRKQTLYFYMAAAFIVIVFVLISP